MITMLPSIPGGASATHGADATVTMAAAYNGGTLTDGSAYVAAPAGLKVVSSNPALATVDGRDGHGIQANLYQGGPNALDGGILYSAVDTLNLTTVYRPGDCIVKVRSSNPRQPNTGDIGRWGLFEGQATVLHVVASPPAAGAMAPIIWPAADAANRPWRVPDVDGLLATLPSYSGGGTATAWSVLAATVDKLDFGHAWAQGVRYQYLTPRQIAGAGNAYDQSRAALNGTVWAGILSNQWSTADKRAALVRMLSIGCQIMEAYRKTGLAFGEDGGQFQSFLPNCLAWMKATGQTALYNTVMPLIGGNVRGQYYQKTAGLFAVHSDPLLPYIARRRTVSAITGSGPYVVTCTGYFPASGLTEDTASNYAFTQLNMVRESNGAVSVITAEARVGADLQLTVATLPTGLVVGNTIYCGEITPIPVGSWDWTARSPSAGFANLTNPSPNAEYRSNNKHGWQVCVASVLGLRGPDLTPAKSYLERVASTVSYQVGADTFAHDFFTANQATILALPQSV